MDVLQLAAIARLQAFSDRYSLNAASNAPRTPADQIEMQVIIALFRAVTVAP